MWKSLIQQVALRSYDACFQLVCERGFAVGLEAACQGFGLGAKLEGMHGSIAPEMWSGGFGKERKERIAELMETTGLEPGTPAAQRRVLEYVMRDAKMTYDVYEEIAKHNELRWINDQGQKSGHCYWHADSNSWPMVDARECLTIAEPDTDLLSEHLRSKFARGRSTGWLEEGE